MSDTAFSRRFAKALATLGDEVDPLGRLAAVRWARETLERLEQETAAEARAAGATWGEIATLYGVSKQAAHQRFRRPSKPAAAGPSPSETGSAVPNAAGPPAKAVGKTKPTKRGNAGAPGR